MSVPEGRAVPRRGAYDDADAGRHSRALELLAVIILGMATLGSAWCGYQAAAWNGEQTDAARESAEARIEASREFALATQKVTYDASVATQYAAAYAAKQQGLLDFYDKALVRDEFRPVLERWKADAAAGKAPDTSLLEQPGYLDGLFAPSRKADLEAEAHAQEGEVAGENSDAYVLATLLMASALFFAGVMSTFRSRTAQALLVAAAALVFALATARVIGLPVA